MVQSFPLTRVLALEVKAHRSAGVSSGKNYWENSADGLGGFENSSFFSGMLRPREYARLQDRTRPLVAGSLFSLDLLNLASRLSRITAWGGCSDSVRHYHPTGEAAGTPCSPVNLDMHAERARRNRGGLGEELSEQHTGASTIAASHNTQHDHLGHLPNTIYPE